MGQNIAEESTEVGATAGEASGVLPGLRWDSLGEPAASRFLRVVRHELATSIADEITSDRGRGVLDLIMRTLDHLTARDERLEELLLPLLETQRVVLSRSVAGDRLPPTGAQSNTSHGAAHLALAPQVEQEIARALDDIKDGAEPRNESAWQGIQSLMRAEADFHSDVELYEGRVATAAADALQAESPALLKSRLETYLNGRELQSGLITVEEITWPMGGLSKDTLIATLSGRGRPADAIVIRRDVAHGPLEGVVASEYAVIKAMSEAGVPVAQPLWAETNPTILGGPFIVVTRMPGKPLVDVKLQVVGEGAAECVKQLARVLARIHHVDPRLAGVSEADAALSVQAHVNRELDQYEKQWRRRRMGPNSVVAAGFAWMRHNVPKNLSAPPCIVHGDATVRNMLFADNKVTAMLDWETWHLGDPGEDVAYSRMDVERFMPWSEFLAEYHAAGGPEFGAESERFWGMWSYLRGAVSSISMMDRLLYDPPADIRPAFAGPHYTRFCTRKIADYLLNVTSG
jgi:aminoglycoside phosphotransferase (APT) family kinase protein